ncbi:MAG: DUF881 domain-containing protein [Nocardioides sp.]|uniref:DUF881 domain-containing protein n=1 Tax=Nocardioides sp. TaxID=35761 RepID=UPI003F03049C
MTPPPADDYASAPRPASPPAAGAAPPALPAHVTTPLLTLITQRSLDEDYAAAAERRTSATGDRPAPGRRFAVGTGVAVALFGLLVTVIGLQTQRDAEVDQLSRDALIAQVEERRERVSDLQSKVRELEVANRGTLQANADLAAQVDDARADLEQLGMSTGSVAVRGPGVRITVRSAAGAEPNSQIRDEDLATLVDGLWHAGAEAISINGERLSATTGIRNTGRSIHVGGRPITEPFVINVIGDPGSLQADLLASSQGQVWFELANALGFEYVPENVTDLRLPAARLDPLRVVEQGSQAYRSGTLYGEEENE